MAETTRWWTPARHADRRPILLARNRIEAEIRAYLMAQDFVLVDPPGLQRSPGNETHLHAFSTQMLDESGRAETRYLHTSPEFSMKKLLAAGEQRIASLGHVWRNRERTANHHPEFTMLEWYRVGEPYTAVMDDCLEMIRIAARVTGATALRSKGRTADPFAAAERLSVAEAFARAVASRRTFERLERPEAWLRTVAVNVARTRHRRSALGERLLGRRAEPVAQRDVELSDERMALVAALRALPAGQREALALHYLADLPIGEVADTLGVAVGTVKARLSRGRTALAEALGAGALVNGGHHD